MKTYSARFIHTIYGNVVKLEFATPVRSLVVQNTRGVLKDDTESTTEGTDRPEIVACKFWNWDTPLSKFKTPNNTRNEVKWRTSLLFKALQGKFKIPTHIFAYEIPICNQTPVKAIQIF